MKPKRIIAVGDEPEDFPKVSGYWCRYCGIEYSLNTETSHRFWFQIGGKEPYPPERKTR